MPTLADSLEALAARFSDLSVQRDDVPRCYEAMRVLLRELAFADAASTDIESAAWIHHRALAARDQLVELRDAAAAELSAADAFAREEG